MTTFGFLHSFKEGMYYISLIDAADKAVNKTCSNGTYILEQGSICKQIVSRKVSDNEQKEIKQGDLIITAE